MAEYIEDAADRPNKKSVLDDLIQDLTGKQGGYDKREYSWIVARHVKAGEISGDLVETYRGWKHYLNSNRFHYQHPLGADGYIVARLISEILPNGVFFGFSD